MPDPRIEVASPEQLEILREILADLGSTRITSVVVRPYDPAFEEDITPPPGPNGAEIVVASAPEDPRRGWEAELLALAFARRSKSAGLRRVAWFAFGGGGAALEHAPSAAAPLNPKAIDRFRADVAAAVGDATLARFDVLRPQGHAFAIVVRVDEAHAFLRSHSRPFLTSLAEWRERCDGIYAELRDADPDPAVTVGWYQGGGFSTRGDVECCAPFLGLSHPIASQPLQPAPLSVKASLGPVVRECHPRVRSPGERSRVSPWARGPRRSV